MNESFCACSGRSVEHSSCGAVRCRAGAVTNAGAWYDRGSAKQRFAKGYALHRAREPRRDLGDLNRPQERATARAAADEASSDAEERECALTCLAKRQVEQALVATLVHQRVDIDHRRANDRGQFRVRHLQPRKPQPLLTDAAIEITKPVQIR